MLVLKYILLVLILAASSKIGIIIAKKYKNRVIELSDFKETINILKTKIKFTYEPLSEIFNEISEITSENISKIFKQTSLNMKKMPVMQAWEQSLEESKNILSLNRDDINVLKGLGKMLGKTDVDGQISEIEVVSEFIETQIKKADIECSKNEKMYRTLGTIIGLAIAIILF